MTRGDLSTPLGANLHIQARGEEALDERERAEPDRRTGSRDIADIGRVVSRFSAGSLGLRMTVPAFRIAEIGYGLRAGWRGRGLATRSVRLVADWAFTRVGIARLELGAAAANTASRQVAARAGFQLIAGRASTSGRAFEGSRRGVSCNKYR